MSEERLTAQEIGFLLYALDICKIEEEKLCRMLQRQGYTFASASDRAMEAKRLYNKLTGKIVKVEG